MCRKGERGRKRERERERERERGRERERERERVRERVRERERERERESECRMASEMKQAPVDLYARARAVTLRALAVTFGAESATLRREAAERAWKADESDKLMRAAARRLKYPDYYDVVDSLYGKCASCTRILPVQYKLNRRGHRNIACAGCLTARYCTPACLADHRYTKFVKDDDYVFEGHKEACDRVASARLAKQQGIRGASKEVRKAKYDLGVDVLFRWQYVAASCNTEKAQYMPAALHKVPGLDAEPEPADAQ